MRKTISKYLKKSDYLIHADMFNINSFPTLAKVINCGLGESNALNLASGIASKNNTVYIYGVCGFIIHRYEQLKFSARNFGSKTGKIILINAGKIGYSGLGNGHKLDDDLEIMKILNIKSFCPDTKEELLQILEDIKNKNNGIFYIQLGKDF